VVERHSRLAHPTEWQDETTGAVTRNRGLRSLCEPAGGLWRRWRRRQWWWGRWWRRVDHSYDDRRFDHHDDNGHNEYDECGNHNVVGLLGLEPEPLPLERETSGLRTCGPSSQLAFYQINPLPELSAVDPCRPGLCAPNVPRLGQIGVRQRLAFRSREAARIRVLAPRVLGIAAEVDCHAGFVAHGPRIVARLDSGNVARTDLPLFAAVGLDAHAAR